MSVMATFLSLVLAANMATAFQADEQPGMKRLK